MFAVPPGAPKVPVTVAWPCTAPPSWGILNRRPICARSGKSISRAAWIAVSLMGRFIDGSAMRDGSRRMCPLSVVRLPPEIMMSPLPISPSSINLWVGTAAISEDRSKPAMEVRAGTSRKSKEKPPARVCKIPSTSPPKTECEEALTSRKFNEISAGPEIELIQAYLAVFCCGLQSQIADRIPIDISVLQLKIQIGYQICRLVQRQNDISLR